MGQWHGSKLRNEYINVIIYCHPAYLTYKVHHGKHMFIYLLFLMQCLCCMVFIYLLYMMHEQRSLVA